MILPFYRTFPFGIIQSAIDVWGAGRIPVLPGNSSHYALLNSKFECSTNSRQRGRMETPGNPETAFFLLYLRHASRDSILMINHYNY